MMILLPLHGADLTLSDIGSSFSTVYELLDKLSMISVFSFLVLLFRLLSRLLDACQTPPRNFSQ